MWKIFKKQSRQECINEISEFIHENILNTDLTHSEKVIVLNNVALKLKKQREEILNDIVNANSI